MPYVSIRLLKDGVTREQKAQLVEEITGSLQRILNKKPENTHIVIDEVELDNWGYKGMLTSEMKKQSS